MPVKDQYKVVLGFALLISAVRLVFCFMAEPTADRIADALIFPVDIGLFLLFLRGIGYGIVKEE